MFNDDDLLPLDLEPLVPLEPSRIREAAVEVAADQTLKTHLVAMPGDKLAASPEEVLLVDLMHIARNINASDVHITCDLAPVYRVYGVLYSLNMPVLRKSDIQRIVYDILNDEQIAHFEKTKELDVSYETDTAGRFRVNVYRQQSGIACAMRAIPTKISTIDDLDLPPVIKDLTELQSGLILVCGQTGSGKSTTIAAMIDAINSSSYKHILTLEDPIEFVHKHKKSMVNQREIGSDSESFHNCIRAALREDPDVIMFGEMRDLETIQSALTLSETGHLVFGTLHTRNAPQSIDRMIDVFSPEQQEQIRVLLGNTLQAVIAQQLIPAKAGGRVCAIEVMVANNAIRNLIRESKTHQIYSTMETSKSLGMQTMDASLGQLVKSGKIDFSTALERCSDKDRLTSIISG